MRGAAVRRGRGNYDTGPESLQDSAAAAVDDWLDSESWGQLPTSDYRVKRDDGDRVLFSYDVGEQTKIAIIVADAVADLDGDEGWGVESWALCDPAELPAATTELLGIAVWRDADGARVPVSRITSYQGPGFCDWQDITFLARGLGYAGGAGEASLSCI